MSYTIFTRNWYLADGVTPNYNGRKRFQKQVNTQEEAVEFCTKMNENRPKSWEKRSKKYEFEGGSI